jgi:drug/metabolite transporter (DMT)-like permease
MNRTPARIALLFFGVFCGATAVIMIKASDESPLLIAAYRLLLATLFLSPLFFLQKQNTNLHYGKEQVAWSALPGIFLAAHFITWTIGVPLTQVSNASLIVNMTPVVMPFFLWLFFRERVNRKEVLGTLLAISGLVVLALSKPDFSLANNRGDLICFFSMLCLAAYLALGRKNGGRLPIWLYMVPLYLIAGLICLAIALPFINPIKSYSLHNLLLILGLALIPTIGGHTTLNFSMKYFRGQVVSVANLGQIIFASIMGFLFFKEVPPPAFYLTAALIISGVLFALFKGNDNREAIQSTVGK